MTSSIFRGRILEASGSVNIVIPPLLLVLYSYIQWYYINIKNAKIKINRMM
ncbi:hypothetical protein JPSP13_06880 [Staphylococcus pseudintermedius]